MSTFTNAMRDLVNFRSDVVNQDSSTVSNVIAAWRAVAKSQALKREQFALTAALNAVINALHVYDLTMAYEYKGSLYAVHKSYRAAPVGGVFSTEYLHSLDLDQATWDAMPKFNVWVKTGKVFSEIV